MSMFFCRMNMRLLRIIFNECRNSRTFTSVANSEKKFVFNSAFISRKYITKHLPQLHSSVGFPFLTKIERNYSKKKKESKHEFEDEEESDSEDEEDLEPEETGDGYNVVSKSVASLRVDTILKAGLGISKKKIEKELYASNVWVNGEKAVKKAVIVGLGDEIDLVKGLNPDNTKLINVDRVIIKSIGKVTGTGTYPLKMQVFKSLPIENYQQTWTPEKF